MRLIAFDTSTEWCSAALWTDGEVQVREAHAGQRHSELLHPMLRELCNEAGIAFTDLDGLAYGMGPGSFTGLRIAGGVAQGVALAANLPVIGVPTLEALAESAWQEQQVARVLACLDARMNEVYVAAYARHEGCWREVLPPRVCPPHAVRLPESWDAGEAVGLGSGFASYAEALSGVARQLAAVDPAGFPHAASVVRLAAPRFARGEGGPAETAELLYIRDKVALKISERQAKAA